MTEHKLYFLMFFTFFLLFKPVTYCQNNIPNDILSILPIGKSKSEVRNLLGANGYILAGERDLKSNTMNLSEDADIFLRNIKENVIYQNSRIQIISNISVLYCNDISYLANIDYGHHPSKDLTNYIFDFLKGNIKNSIYRRTKSYNIKSNTYYNAELGEFKKEVFNLSNSPSYNPEIKLSSRLISNSLNYTSVLVMGAPDDCSEKLQSKYTNPLDFWDVKDMPSEDLEAHIVVFFWDIYHNVYENDKTNYEDFYEFYYRLSQANKNIYFKDIRDYENKPDYNTIAIARGMYDDSKAEKQDDLNNWNYSNYLRMWILYHELAHDIFNIEHYEGGPLMMPELPEKITESSFNTARKYLINYLKLLRFNPECNEVVDDLNNLFIN